MSAATRPVAPTATTSVSVGKLGVFTLAMMNLTAVVSLRGQPAEAEYGLGSISSSGYLAPVSFCCAPCSTLADRECAAEAHGKGVHHELTDRVRKLRER
jgi:hypothetical protein